MNFISTLAVLFLCSIAGIAQDAVPEPEFSDVFFRLDSGKLVPLERQTAAIQGKAGGFMVMNVKAVSEFPGAKSPVRFRSDQSLDFIVRSFLAQSSFDPNAQYVLRKLGEKKKSRELVITSLHATPFGASSTTNLAQGVLQVTFTRYGASSLKMTTGPLSPGEYAVSKIYAQTVFCFGVD